MKQYKYYFPDGSVEYAFSPIQAFILHNAKRLENGYGIVTSMKDEKWNTTQYSSN